MSLASEMRATALSVLEAKDYVRDALNEIRAAAREGTLETYVEVTDRVSHDGLGGRPRLMELIAYLTEQGFSVRPAGKVTERISLERTDIVTTRLCVGWGQ